MREVTLAAGAGPDSAMRALCAGNEQNRCMRIVYHAENIIDANLVKAALEHEQVVAFISGEYLTGAIGELPAWNLVAVMVAEHDVERALPVVRAVDQDLRQHRELADLSDLPVPGGIAPVPG
jgi:hypothetical protein